MKRISTSVRASDGIAIGRAYVVVRETVQDSAEPAGSVVQEREKFDKALSDSIVQIAALAETDDIFAAHLEMVQDDMLRESVEAHIDGGESAIAAVRAAGEETAAMFAAIDDEYLRAREADVRDIFARIAANLTGGVRNPFDGVQEGDIVVADTLTPSDMTMIDFTRVRGFVTKEGSATSHVCIIARNRDIPAVVGLHDAADAIATGDMLAVDASGGEVVIAPDEATLAHYNKAAEEYRARRRRENESAGRTFRDGSGRPVHVFANAGDVGEVRAAIAAGADGIGLFRSEFLYMQSASVPSEQQQYEAYAAAAEACGGRPLIIRTLDIGGDKALPYLDFGREENPFLGWRAIRVSLAMRDMFRRQLRAILRAGAHGDVRIMFPMIVDMEELRAAKSLLEECKAELLREGAAFDGEMKVGVMVETPAAVFIAAALAAECDFFSIGTNDLIHYIMGIDRNNRHVAYLNEPLHPAVVRSLKRIIDAAHREGIGVSVCGELASDPFGLALLLGMGVDTVSAAPRFVPGMKHLIRHFNAAGCMNLAHSVLLSTDVPASKRMVRETLQQSLGHELAFHTTSLFTHSQP